jgi:transposase
MSAMIQFPLDLPDVEVLKTELTAKGQLVITVESTLEGTRCRRCGQEIREPHGHDRPLRLRHLPVLERPVTIEIRSKRYRCPFCSDHPTTTQRCSGYEPNSPHTRAFEQHALRSLINSTVSPSLPQDQPQGARERRGRRRDSQPAGSTGSGLGIAEGARCTGAG